MEAKFRTVIIMVKFVGHNGKICVKCNEAVAYLEKRNLMQYVTNIWTADIRDASSDAIRYAKNNFIRTFPFFLIRHFPESNHPMDEIYLSVGKFAERLTYLLDNDSPQCYDGFKGEENMEETIARVAGNSIPQIERFIVESEEKKGVKYTVDVWTAIGQAACSCMDFIARKGPAGLPCKHIRAVLGQDNAPELTIHPADAYWITSMKPL